MKKTVSISPASLSQLLKERFEAMLPVVAGRSIVQWELCDTADADVVVQEHGDRLSLCITHERGLLADAGTLPIERDFRVATLMQTLDLAAVRVLNRRDSAVRTAQGSIADQGAPLYQLKYWDVPGHRTPMKVLRTLAAMTRRPVSREWMTTVGGLSPPEADSLLAGLELRGALRSSSAQRVPQAAPRAQAGFVSRLKHWLRGGRATVPTAAPR
ncbi:hypothetical protein [Variovorax sp. RA8]|uniref:hypothetical protein n=1 Tax=Variovorax sp. (strain JCM 16519 / RA8) TaxID=662548 RepID=UPI001316327D|nr:hypothetical protein [Variovorax sp. RA8]VTU19832.1 hypothetical protein RA8CHR_02009 [Variovorax sp. RA8]